MKIFNLFKLVVIATTLFLVSCRKDDMSNNNLGVVERYEINISSEGKRTAESLIADGVNVNFTLKEGQTVKTETGISLNLSFTGEATLVNGEKQSINNGRELFSNFTEKITIAKGEKSSNIKFNIEHPENYKAITGTFSISSRDAVANTKDLPIKLFSKTQIMLLVNGTQVIGDEPVSVYSTRQFNFGFSSEENISENIVISISRNGKDKVDITNTESLTFAQNTMEVSSEELTATIKDGVTEGIIPIVYTLSINSNKYELSKNSFTINIISPTNGLSPANMLTDERWVYPFADEVFVSSISKNEVETLFKGKKGIVEMKAGDPHPNKELAKEGWTFRNALEFSPIPSSIAGGKANEFGNRVPRYMGEQNTQRMQNFQGIYNDRYTHIDDDGELLLWSAKGDNLYKNWYDKNGGNKAPHGTIEYGTGAFHLSKFQPNNPNSYKWEDKRIPIMPGTRVEVRMRCAGQLYKFIPALWFQGNQQANTWPYYGEVDMLEAPKKTEDAAPEVTLTYHWSDNPKGLNPDKSHYHPTTGKIDGVDLTKYNIYWMEWRSNDEVAVGINGKEMLVVRSSDYKASGQHWPFTATYNKAGMHMLITFPPLDGSPKGTYDKYMKDIPYAESKSNPNTPRMLIDYIRFYKNSNYINIQYEELIKNDPLY